MKKTLLGIVLVLSVFGGLGLAGWYFVKNELASQTVYRLLADKIIVPQRPAWVPDDFVLTALRNSNGDAEISLLDKSLPQKLSQAFTASPWVESVERVTIQYPSGAVIDLTYRSPAALVLLDSSNSFSGSFPVDRSGVLLPTDYFVNLAPEKIQDYLQIREIHSMPLGTAGTLWGDPLVHDAAGLAGQLRDIAPKLNIVGIVPFQQPTPAGNRVFCTLVTKKGMKILWGRFEPDDPKNETRKKHLWDLAQMYRSLDDIPKNFQPVDLTKE